MPQTLDSNQVFFHKLARAFLLLPAQLRVHCGIQSHPDISIKENDHNDKGIHGTNTHIERSS